MLEIFSYALFHGTCASVAKKKNPKLENILHNNTSLACILLVEKESATQIPHHVYWMSHFLP
jgi:hypothetical protein